MVRSSPRFPNRLAVAAAAALALALPACSDAREVSVSETKVSVIEETHGMGKKAKDGDIVCVDYRVMLPDGEELMWSQNFCFELGAGVVIAGLDEAVPGMRRGGMRTVKVPSHKHWGSAGYADVIPERVTLHVEVKLIEIE